jgi:hypothetical protein
MPSLSIATKSENLKRLEFWPSLASDENQQNHSGMVWQARVSTAKLYCSKADHCHIKQTFCFCFCFFWWDWGLNSGLHACKAYTLSLEPHTLPVHFALVILEMGVSQTICLGWPQTCILLISASQQLGL